MRLITRGVSSFAVGIGPAAVAEASFTVAMVAPAVAIRRVAVAIGSSAVGVGLTAVAIGLSAVGIGLAADGFATIVFAELCTRRRFGWSKRASFGLKWWTEKYMANAEYYLKHGINVGGPI